MKNLYEVLMHKIDALRTIIENQNGQPLQAADSQLLVAAIDGKMVVALVSHMEDEVIVDGNDDEAAGRCLDRLAKRLTPLVPSTEKPS